MPQFDDEYDDRPRRSSRDNTHRVKGSFGAGLGGCFGGCMGMVLAGILCIALLIGGIVCVRRGMDKLPPRTQQSSPPTSQSTR